MDIALEGQGRITPNLVRRTGGGWLAIAPKEAVVKLAVTAATEDEAREKFSSVMHRWIEILNSAQNSENT